MANEEIIVGKHTLESLTIGMYSDPFTIYREYVQNASDSLDEAKASGLISAKEGKIDIAINEKYSTIEITDNGTGISIKDAYKILCDIGNSKKDYAVNRGFRGIGRLGGLGYADKLIFETSFKGESKKSKVTWDCMKLKEMLQPGKFKTHDIIKVIKEVSEYHSETEKSNEHYFIVRLEGVNQQFKELLNEERVNYYLSTVAPVPFDCQKFIFANQIKDFFKIHNMQLDEYTIILNKSPKPILKKYRTNFKTGQQERTNQQDRITELELFEGRSEDSKELFYIGWLGICNFRGTVQDEYMRGIRIRKGNILIGNEQTFGQFFSSEPGRANGVFIGEVHIFWKDIIPNARRDDFNKNGAYKYLAKLLGNKADEINRKYRRGFSQVNSAIRKYSETVNKIKEIKDELKDGITSVVHKERLLEDQQKIERQLDTVVSDLSRIQQKNDIRNGKNGEISDIIKKHSTLKKDILHLENKIVETDFKGKDELSFLSTEQRRMYKMIIEVIDRELEKEEAKKLINKIIHALKLGQKKK